MLGNNYQLLLLVYFVALHEMFALSRFSQKDHNVFLFKKKDYKLCHFLYKWMNVFPKWIFVGN